MYHLNVMYEKKTVPIEYHNDDRLSTIPHMHKEVEIIYDAGGSCAAYADDNRCVLKPGDLFVAFPNQIHYYEMIEDGSFYVLVVSTEIFLGLERMLKSNVPVENLIHIAQDDPARQLLEEIRRVGAEKENVCRMTAMNGYINLLMCSVLPQLTLVPFHSGDNATLRTILEYCVHHFNEELSLEKLSEDLHFSKYYISHMMNRSLNMGLNEYINALRVDAACRLLSNTDKKIADISEDVGFGTIRSFNRAFRQQQQMTPAEFRARAKA